MRQGDVWGASCGRAGGGHGRVPARPRAPACVRPAWAVQGLPTAAAAEHQCAALFMMTHGCLAAPRIMLARGQGHRRQHQAPAPRCRSSLLVLDCWLSYVAVMLRRVRGLPVLVLRRAALPGRPESLLRAVQLQARRALYSEWSATLGEGTQGHAAATGVWDVPHSGHRRRGRRGRERPTLWPLSLCTVAAGEKLRAGARVLPLGLNIPGDQPG